MASETLSVPEEHLPEVIEVIRAGLSQVATSSTVRDALREWCIAEEYYLEELARGERE
ncbi:MAG: hypothetical protein LN413_00565 [Candidatus Thermoplasmatota archaeon]|nr:hypothetical protein [Candidatus Thermoplasmatota archaeon]